VSEGSGGLTRAAWTDLPIEEVMPGVSRQTLHGKRQTMVRYVYAPGAVFPVHAHPEEQITLVIRGRIAFEVGGERVELGPGEATVIPGGVAHGAAVVGAETVETFNALSPRRVVGPTMKPSP